MTTICCPVTEFQRETPSLISALRRCQQLTRQHSQTFYLGSRLFVPQERAAVWAVYATCRLGDDLVDETSVQAAQQLEQWWRNLQLAYQGCAQEGTVYWALRWAVQRYPIPLSAFAELYQGFQMDLAGQTYQSLDDLSLYCRRVAGVVGLMIAPISGYSGGEQTLQQALRLGQAMQLTNILRDVGEDLRRGRLYLPAELLERFGVTRTSLEQKVLTPEYQALTEYLITVARAWYTEGNQGIPCLQGRGRWAVQLASEAYRGILDDLQRSGGDNLTRRAYVSTPRKLLLVPKAWWLARAQLGIRSTCGSSPSGESSGLGS